MNDKLDTILRQWAEARAPAESRLKALSARITTDAVRVQFVARQGQPAVFPFWTRLAYAAGGAVVAIIVCFGYFMWSVPVVSHGSNASSAVGLAGISTAQAEAGGRFFGEMQRMFADHLRWVVQSNGDVGLGVEPIRGGTEPGSQPLLVRLTVVSKASGDKAWKPVWYTDVMLRGQEVVQVSPNAKSNNSLKLWAYPMADGKIAIDTDLSLFGPVQLTSSSVSVVSPGEPSEILVIRRGNTEFRVFQTVESLSI